MQTPQPTDLLLLLPRRGALSRRRGLALLLANAAFIIVTAVAAA